MHAVPSPVLDGQICTRKVRSLQWCSLLSTAATLKDIICVHTEKAEPAQQPPGLQTTINPAEDNRKKQCRPNETSPNILCVICV